jgi:hypothetical protein
MKVTQDKPREFVPFAIQIETEADAKLISALFGALNSPVTSAFGASQAQTSSVYHYLSDTHGINASTRPSLEIKLKPQ